MATELQRYKFNDWQHCQKPLLLAGTTYCLTCKQWTTLLQGGHCQHCLHDEREARLAHYRRLADRGVSLFDAHPEPRIPDAQEQPQPRPMITFDPIPGSNAEARCNRSRSCDQDAGDLDSDLDGDD